MGSSAHRRAAVVAEKRPALCCLRHFLLKPRFLKAAEVKAKGMVKDERKESSMPWFLVCRSVPSLGMRILIGKRYSVETLRL